MMKTTSLLVSMIALSMSAGCAEEDATGPVNFRPGISLADAEAVDVVQATAADGSTDEIRFPDVRADLGAANWRGIEWEAIRAARADGGIDLALVSNDDLVEIRCARLGGGVFNCIVITSGVDPSLVGTSQTWRTVELHRTPLRSL